MQGWWFDSGHRKVGKGKNMLIKHDIPRYIDTISGNMKTFVTFMKRAIAKKDTLFGAKLELALVIWTEVRPASTPKNPERGIIGLNTKHAEQGRVFVENRSGHMVDEITCRKKGIIPKPEWERRVCQ